MSRQTSLTPRLSEPYVLFIVFVAVGLGTVTMPPSGRLAVLSVALLVLSLVHRRSGEAALSLTGSAMWRGALLGAVIGVPVLVFLFDHLRSLNERLYGTQNVVLLLYQVCFVSAPVEELFFRGVVQEDKGPSVSAALYAAAALVLFLPHAPLLIVLAVGAAMGGLGLAYGYAAQHYGLAAALSCHVTVSLLVQVVPSLVGVIQAALR